MTAQTHARLTEIFNWGSLIAGIPLFLICVLAAFSGDPTPVFVFMAALIGLEIGLALTLWFLPVRCSVPGCNGRMRKMATQLSNFKGRLQYRCTLCDDIYQVDIFQIPPSDPIP